MNKELLEKLKLRRANCDCVICNRQTENDNIVFVNHSELGEIGICKKHIRYD